MSAQPPLLSLILPCYQGAPLAQRTVEVMCDYLPRISGRWELLVVDDGGNDFNVYPLPSDARVRLLRHPRNLGKGAAVRTGMLAATGQVRIFTDVDMPYDRELLPTMADLIVQRGFHMVVGDRTVPGSSYAMATGSRRALSSVASWVIGSLVTGGFHDTQCGIKAVRGDVANLMFPMVCTTRFAFDIEVVYLALKHGLDIKRVPVHLRRNESTSVRPLRDAARAAFDVGALKWRQLQGRYHSDALRRLAVADAEDLLARYRSDRS